MMAQESGAAARCTWTTMSDFDKDTVHLVRLALEFTEDARPGYVLTDVYTIPADRLISKDLNNRSATVTIVQGSTAKQTVIVFVNRAVTTRASEATTVAYMSASSAFDVKMLWNDLWAAVLGSDRKLGIQPTGGSLVN